MAKKFLIKKVSLDQIIDVLVDLYNKGVDYIDIVNADEEGDGKLKVVFTKDYMCKEMRDMIDKDDVEDNEIHPTRINPPSSFSEQDINDLLP